MPIFPLHFPLCVYIALPPPPPLASRDSLNTWSERIELPALLYLKNPPRYSKRESKVIRKRGILMYIRWARLTLNSWNGRMSKMSCKQIITNNKRYFCTSTFLESIVQIVQKWHGCLYIYRVTFLSVYFDSIFSKNFQQCINFTIVYLRYSFYFNSNSFLPKNEYVNHVYIYIYNEKLLLPFLSYSVNPRNGLFITWRTNKKNLPLLFCNGGEKGCKKAEVWRMITRRHSRQRFRGIAVLYFGTRYFDPAKLIKIRFHLTDRRRDG